MGSRMKDERYELIAEIASRVGKKEKAKKSANKAAVALKGKLRGGELTETELQRLMEVDGESTYDKSFDGSGDAMELTEEENIMDAYMEGRGE